MMKIFKSIPGYRSGKGWKIAISSIYYALAVLMAVIVEDISITFILLSLPFILFGFMNLVKQKKPLLFIIGISVLIIGFILLGAAEDGETTSSTRPTVNPTPTIEPTPTAEPMPTPTVKPTAELMPTPVSNIVEPTNKADEQYESADEEEHREAKERTGYIGSCYSATYDELARNPEAYKNKHIHVRGKVAQIISENGLNVLIRINITSSEYDFWTDDVVITYTRQSANESRILEGDIIDVYGVYEGIESYKSAIGDSSFNVPQISAKYIM